METRPRLIGITGHAGSGKTTAATFIKNIYGYQHLRFAGALKDMLRALGLSEAEISGDKKDVPCALLGGKTPRYAMQTLGTEWGRGFISPGLWVNLLMHKVDQACWPIVIDDVRFASEADAILDRGGVVWKVERFLPSYSTHSSETGIDGLPFNTLIRNVGTKMDLVEAVGALMDL